ncbi:TetR/AcrR family transcriptional regulator [Paracoccus sp. 11-3]|uniref:TetR/AcrR family transcriptional regulator n=1 Tax=Paracoccus amoyensis TaxID=2760093 RepID=A0A926J586_9RHOB|nr:TetR/AcrR family transcriptional regulator [Paracoccus amoyensis]MBC9245962.1 TetR/AcrR family transcriptional regulator [Paracoccus amoyensis]
MARTQGSRSEITGPLIRDVARSLFAREGYAAVSMRQIASAVGVQAGALYAYIPDKQALLFDLLESHMQDTLASWHDDPVNPPLIRLEAFVRYHIGFSLDRTDAVFLSYMELRNLTPENFDRIARLRGQYEAALEVILRDGQKTGAMQFADAKLTTLALIAMLTGVTNWYREGGRLDRQRIGDIYWSLVRGAVGAD